MLLFKTNHELVFFDLARIQPILKAVRENKKYPDNHSWVRKYLHKYLDEFEAEYAEALLYTRGGKLIPNGKSSQSYNDLEDVSFTADGVYVTKDGIELSPSLLPQTRRPKPRTLSGVIGRMYRKIMARFKVTPDPGVPHKIMDRKRIFFERVDKAQMACLLLAAHLAQVKHAMLEMGARVPISMTSYRGTALPQIAVDDEYIKYLEVCMHEIIQIGNHLERQTRE